MISMDKKYVTRDGREVVLYCVDAPGDWPVHGRIGNLVSGWTAEGGTWNSGRHDSDDLIEAQPEVWQVYVWRQRIGRAFELVRRGDYEFASEFAACEFAKDEPGAVIVKVPG